MSPWEPGPRLLGNLCIITLGTLRTFTWKIWEPWGNLYNTTLGTLTTFTWETWESWENLYNATLESLRKPWQYNLGTLENLLQCNLGNLEGTFTIQPWEPWKTWEPSGNLEETLREPWQSNLGNLIETFTMSPWEPGPRLLGNLCIIILGTLTTFTWQTWEPCREPWIRNLEGLEGTFWEPSKPWEPWKPLLGNLGGIGFGAAPVCSETFTMAEDPKASAVGEKYMFHIVTYCFVLFMQFQFRCLDWKPLQCILGKLETFTLYPWKAWGNLDNVTLGSLRQPLQCNLGNLENVY